MGRGVIRLVASVLGGLILIAGAAASIFMRDFAVFLYSVAIATLVLLTGVALRSSRKS